MIGKSAATSEFSQVPLMIFTRRTLYLKRTAAGQLRGKDTLAVFFFIQWHVS